MRVLHIGDIVGKPGRKITCRAVPLLRRLHELDLVVANAENIAGGAGITPENYHELIAAGVDCITLGDHIYRRKEINRILRSQSNIVKPANFPVAAPGREFAIVSTAQGVAVAVVSLLGRVFMRPVDCPWHAIDRVLGQLPPEVRVVLIDFHAEATSDKQLMGRYLDGRVSAVLGTHTHVTTADERIMPGGTAFQCDIGMTGPYDSILGRRVDRVMETTLSFNPTFFDVAVNDPCLAATMVDIDETTGHATAIQRIFLTENDVKQLEQPPPPPEGVDFRLV